MSDERITGDRKIIVVPEQVFEQEQADSLRGQIEHARLEGAQRIEISFERCRATSVYALNILADAHEKLKDAGGSLTLSRIKPELREILSNILFDRIVPFAPLQEGD